MARALGPLSGTWCLGQSGGSILRPDLGDRSTPSSPCPDRQVPSAGPRRLRTSSDPREGPAPLPAQPARSDGALGRGQPGATARVFHGGRSPLQRWWRGPRRSRREGARSKARTQSSPSPTFPGRAPEPTSRRLGREHCTDWGDKPLGGITASGSWRRESRRNCTGQVPGPRTWGQTDQRRALLVGASLCPSHHRPRGRGRGGSRERRDLGSPPPRPSDRRRGSDHLVAQTNPPVRGRVSADRSEEAAQPLTTPRLVRKSSTDDSVRLHCMWGLGAFGRVTSTFPDATEVPLHGLRKDGSRHVP